MPFFPCFRPNPYTRMCVSTLGSSLCFVKEKVKLMVNHKSDYFFVCLFAQTIVDNISSLPPLPPPSPTAAAVALTVRATQAPRRAAPGPSAGGLQAL